ncbi:predicted protein [Culex quinquefasciatus]|uniref:Predicted protein n=1 Tax=Culex quinquefasciatus TaxID=7176 RepID=B0X5B7_CULQU|nr:predicted protein [Culex quinquefasciatus]|eukprot:XP_001864839.1 predicted protein [Culex quinquefasciatus]
MDTQVAAAAAAAVAGKVCRLCFAGGGTDDLQLSSVQGTKSLLKRIYECTSVQITAGGGEGGIDQNAQLCQPCVDRIDDFYAYRALCRTNNDHIRQLVQAQPDQVVTIKQEKQLDLDDGGEDSSRHHPLTAANDEGGSSERTKPGASKSEGRARDSAVAAVEHKEHRCLCIFLIREFGSLG